MESFLESLAAAGGKELVDAVEAEFRLGWEREKVLTEMRERSLSESCTRLEAAAVDGLGQLTMDVPSSSYFYWIHHGREALGEENVWKHEEFRRDYLKKNPQDRVRYKSAVPRVGWGGDGRLQDKRQKTEVKAPRSAPSATGLVLGSKYGGVTR